MYVTRLKKWGNNLGARGGTTTPPPGRAQRAIGVVTTSAPARLRATFPKAAGTAAATEKAGGRWRCGRNRVKRQARRRRRRDEERREGGGGGTGRD
jgi:hypothetical protein